MASSELTKSKTPSSLRQRVATAGQGALVSAERGAKEAVRSGTAFTKRHPLATVGTVAGVALVAGALADRALRHEPTLGEVLKKTVARQASRLSKAAASKAKQSASAAGRTISHAMK
jgi:ADP-ribosylglycohydrolase